MLILTNSTVEMTSPEVQFQSNYVAANIEVELSSRVENLNIHFINRKKISFTGDMVLPCIKFVYCTLLVGYTLVCLSTWAMTSPPPPKKKYFQLVFWRLLLIHQGWVVGYCNCTGLKPSKKVSNSSVVYISLHKKSLLSKHLGYNNFYENILMPAFWSSLVLQLFPLQCAALRSITKLMLV